MPRQSRHNRPPRPARRGPASPGEGGRHSARWPIIRFVLLFALFMGAFFAVTALPVFKDRVFTPYLYLVADASAWLLRRLGEDAGASGWTVSSPRTTMMIQRGCDALDPAALFVSAVLAFPGWWRRKLLGVATGIGVLLVLNQVRILSLYYVGVHWPTWFEFMHVEVWQTVFMVLAMVLWIAWAWWAIRPRREKPSEAPPEGTPRPPPALAGEAGSAG